MFRFDCLGGDMEVHLVSVQWLSQGVYVCKGLGFR